MSCGSGVCECWRLTRDGVHGSTSCVFYGMHWREVAALRPAAEETAPVPDTTNTESEDER